MDMGGKGQIQRVRLGCRLTPGPASLACGSPIYAAVHLKTVMSSEGLPMEVSLPPGIRTTLRLPSFGRLAY